ncbi:succinylglutamate desuccinylase/aspartoacylase family protein [Xanthovirga aplysinae]|uniref:succinylglutamate desuccinylase/aspartoacylase family protein n=1 Tax=Xanthovirga aplysinae TaxID=2529853 RepID=UPI0012BB4CDE|nr:succinylglutamate desuccinylase/aspartoacylase family protein [Xanthovirga aplysinae]MTI32424.1 succinylglutamate desuccinylase/aspartoacylase family protein [Xanthovirga aplysinae]
MQEREEKKSVPKEEEPFFIAGIQIAKVTPTKINFPIAKLPSGNPMEIPTFVFRAKEKGPVLLLTAGLHGNEINGMEILRRAIKEEVNLVERGTVICIPVVNVFGFLQFSRYVPDGKDINRSFPGNRSGSLASRIAFFLRNYILPIIDYGLDFHTGGASRANHPQIRCTFNHPTSLELAKAFAPPFIINSRLRDHSFRQFATKHGKCILLYEAGETLRLDESVINTGLDGIKRIMNFLEMKTFETPILEKSELITHSSWLRAKQAGLFRTHLKTGSKILKNQTLGFISSPYADLEIKITSPFEGYILALNHNPVVNMGDALIHIGRASPTQKA